MTFTNKGHVKITDFRLYTAAITYITLYFVTQEWLQAPRMLDVLCYLAECLCCV